MDALVGLLLIGVCYAVETSCDGRQDGAQCVGALGGAVNIQLMDDALEINRFQWIKGESFIVQWRNKTNVVKAEGNTSLFIPSNGTVRINNLKMNDSGEYKLKIFGSDGLQTGSRTLQLSVQAPVSSVQLVSGCLSQGQMKVSCSSEGDSPQYSWTLDGHTLTDSELLSGNDQTNVIVLRQNISGRLGCSVRNQVSQSFREKSISTCGFIFNNCTSNGTLISEWVFRENNTLCVQTELNQTVTLEPSWYIKQWSVMVPMVGALSVLVFVLVVGTTVLCVKNKKQRIKVEEDDQNLTYSNVKIVQQKKKQVKDRVEEEVENEQVGFSERPCPSEAAADDCQYTQVHRGWRPDVFELKHAELQKSDVGRR